jgi:hypothetical protein
MELGGDGEAGNRGVAWAHEDKRAVNNGNAASSLLRLLGSFLHGLAGGAGNFMEDTK